MKNWILAIIVAMVTLGISQQGQALAEIRVGYGTQTWDEDVGGEDFEPLYGLNADILITPPLLGFGFGLRYESLGYDKDGVDFTYTRTSILINKRLIDTVFYVGAIGSIGFNNTGTYETALGDFDVEGDGFNYTIGAEAGVGLGLISIGGEVGYMFGTLEADGGVEIDSAGPYAKAIVSFGF